MMVKIRLIKNMQLSAMLVVLSCVELLNIIFSECKIRDRKNIACVCNKFNEIIASNKYFDLLSRDKIDRIHFFAHEKCNNKIVKEIEAKYPELVMNKVIKFISMKTNRYVAECFGNKHDSESDCDIPELIDCQ